ncbi:(2,3-dihydroxybenzoyl)adenylate synthase [Endozoicomonas sp. SM1973]|uniref:(2,3-dihydroxybenzoyl)adenylate synthase n=1 Tax=Spartinivicinus marinus TaxID=2994442 RepID=A0A853I677_9GAMM|nr:(2,3-dihydroxybenzoyl)adenylate synthase [Spartinivicinus marinus]MCX4029493.1 (2,3-dihydroxybenzoyl)adenylate synthase [Spartinivicinus marinus]NYZ65067.1 (2,3-dihydroxybenzoyl)adenylate synthase [Spartinivicinus marinus]
MTVVEQTWLTKFDERDCPKWPQAQADYYRQAGYWQGITFGEMLKNQARQLPHHEALVAGKERWTYQLFDQKVDQLVRGFHQLGIQDRDVVVVQLPNINEFFAVCFALFRLGAIPVMALPAHRRIEIRYFCQFTQAKAYIIADKYFGFDYCQLAREIKAEVSSLKQVIVVGEPQEFTALSDLYLEAEANDILATLTNPNASHTALLQVSGGTTGLPKLIPRTHDDYLYSVKVSAEICGVNSHSIYLCSLPVAHNFPLSSPGTLGVFYAGGKVVLMQDTTPEAAFSLIEQEQITIAALVPPTTLLWLEAAKKTTYDLSSLQILQVGGAKFSAEAAKQVKPVLGCQLQQVFGMAEGLVNYTRLTDNEEICNHTQGKPMSPADEIRVVDEEGNPVLPGEVGQLQTRGPYTICGYYKAPQHNTKAFTTDGFYCTGDEVKLTESGYLMVVGRIKDQINRGGEKIAAEEVENQLLAHPAVHDVALVAMPDDILGEASCAFVICHADQPTKVMVLKRFLRERGLASYKIPDRIEFVDSFPKTAVGKVNKKALRCLTNTIKNI